MLTYHPHLVATGARFPSDLLSERVNFLFFLSVLHILPIYIPWFRYHNNTWCGFCDGLIARSEFRCVYVCDLETSTMRWTMPEVGCSAMGGGVKIVGEELHFIKLLSV